MSSRVYSDEATAKATMDLFLGQVELLAKCHEVNYVVYVETARDHHRFGLRVDHAIQHTLTKAGAQLAAEYIRREVEA